MSMRKTVEEAILKLINSSHKQKFISQVLDVSLNSIRTVVKKTDTQYKGIESRKRNNKEMVIDLYSQGKSKKEICNLLNLNSKNVSDFLIEEGIYLSKLEIEKLVLKYFKDGFSTTSIANHLRISYKTVIKILKDNNIETSKNNYSGNKLVDRTKNNISIMYKEGMSIGEIAKKLDLKEVIILHDLNFKSKG